MLAAIGTVAFLVLLAVLIPKEPAEHERTLPVPATKQGPTAPPRDRETGGPASPGPQRPAPHIATFEFVPGQVRRGGSAELHWNVENATRVTIDGRAANPSGRIAVRPERSLTARLVAEGPGGVSERTAAVDVQERGEPVQTEDGVAVLSFTAAPSEVAPGQPVHLTWAVQGAQYVSISPGVGTLSGASGSLTVRPMTSTRYTLEARGRQLSAPVTRQVDVVVRSETEGVSRRTAGGWDVYHHHGLMVPNFAIDWGQMRDPRGVVRGGDTRDRCFGVLSIQNGRLVFQSRTSGDGFAVALPDLEKVAVNRTNIGGRESFQVKVRRGRNYNFVPRQPASAVVGAINAQR
jgi:hypothetical protein